jgi:hypothetical protein
MPRPKRSYVYAIHVDGVLRYIGKGSNDRMYAHMKEVKQRLTRKFKLKNISPSFQQKLTEAVMQGAVVEEIVLVDNLTSKQAYKLEYRHLEEMVYAGKRQQLWNIIPQTIYTPEEHEAYVSRLTENLTSKDRWVRYLSRNHLKRLGHGRHQPRFSSDLVRDASSPRPGPLRPDGSIAGPLEIGPTHQIIAGAPIAVSNTPSHGISAMNTRIKLKHPSL